MPKVDPDSLPYRPCVGCMVFNHQGHVFLGRRTKRVAFIDEQMPEPAHGFEPLPHRQGTPGSLRFTATLDMLS